MKLSINGETKEMNFATLAQWASAELENAKGIAIAVNESVIPNSKWDRCALKDGDKILVVTATCGG
ncbi:MAG: sulfur carrier protein ThiS [Fibromonadales bacterium]|nr:sulfur carrier protein ThiS [Fibromonadales bacterium]